MLVVVGSLDDHEVLNFGHELDFAGTNDRRRTSRIVRTGRIPLRQLPRQRRLLWVGVSQGQYVELAIFAQHVDRARIAERRDRQ